MGLGCLRYLGLGAIGLVGLNGAAAAQQGDRLSVTLSGRALYDDNLARSSKQVAKARGLVQEDFRFSPLLEVRAFVPLGRSRVFGDARLGYDFHARNKRLDRDRIQAHAGVETRSGACLFTLEGSGNRQQTELEEIGFEPVVNTERILDARAGLNCPREGRLSPNLSVDHRSTRNSNLQRKTADINADTAEAGLSYGGTPIADLSLALRYSRVEFPNRPVAAGTDGYQLYQAGLRFSRSVGSIARGSARLAYTRVDVKGQLKPFSGNTFAVDLGFLPYGKIRPHLLVERSIDPVNRLNVLYRVQSFAQVDTTVLLTAKMRLTGSVSRRDAKFRLVPNTAGQVSREKTWLEELSLDLDIRPRLTASFFAQSEKRDTDPSLFSFDSKRFGVSTRLIF